MIQRGGFLKSAEPGKTANFALRAPRYSFLASVSFNPMCESKPERREVWMGSGAASCSLRWTPIVLATVRSCE